MNVFRLSWTRRPSIFIDLKISSRRFADRSSIPEIKIHDLFRSLFSAVIGSIPGNHFLNSCRISFRSCADGTSGISIAKLPDVKIFGTILPQLRQKGSPPRTSAWQLSQIKFIAMSYPKKRAGRNRGAHAAHHPNALKVRRSNNGLL